MKSRFCSGQTGCLSFQDCLSLVLNDPNVQLTDLHNCFRYKVWTYEVDWGRLRTWCPLIFLDIGERETKWKQVETTNSKVRTSIIVLATRLRDGRKGTEIPFRTVDFLITKHVRTDSGVQPAYTPMGTAGLSRDKTATTWRWPLPFIEIRSWEWV
jgi:hypothetical protein